MHDLIQITFSETTLSIINNAWTVPAGIIILYVYGWLHFNTPAYPIELIISGEPSLTDTARLITPAPPIYTTRRQYYNRFALCYIGLLQLAFLVCVFWYSIVRDISRAEDITIPDLTRESLQYRTVFALFLLVGLLPSFPVLKDVDDWLLKRLHRSAYIPDEAKFLAQNLYNSQLDFSLWQFDKVSLMTARDIVSVVNHDCFGVLEKRVIEYLYLYEQTQNIVKMTRYRNFRIQFDQDVISITNQHGKLRSELNTYFRKQERLMPGNISDIDAFIVDNGRKYSFQELSTNRNELKLKCDVQYMLLCVLISMTVGSSSSNVDDINVKIMNIGFRTYATPTLGESISILVPGVATLLLVLFNIVYFILGSYVGMFSLFPIMMPTKVSIVLFSGAFVFAYPLIMWLILKLHRRWRRVGPVRSVWKEQSLVALYSYVAALPVNLLLDFYLSIGHPYYASLFLSLNQGVFGCFIAIYMGNLENKKLSPIKLPFYQGIIQAMTTLIVLWFGGLFITEGAGGGIFGLSLSNLGFSMIQAGVSGVIFGTLVQKVYGGRGDRGVALAEVMTTGR